jgi:hypothetical protein
MYTIEEKEMLLINDLTELFILKIFLVYLRTRKKKGMYFI